MTTTIGSQHDQSLPLGSLSSTTSARLVRSFNEWDPLEEVIVGSLEGAVMPPSHITVTRTIPPLAAQLYRLFGGHRYPRIMVDAARRELEGFVKLLQAEGITVKRPDTMDFTVRARTPFWNSKGYCVACPRDGFVIVGDEIETPMAWRSRYFEGHAFRKLFKDYFARGARWTAASRPELRDELFDYKWTRPHKDEAVRYMITEFEPVFDAADFVRCGRDLFGIRSNLTNAAGFEWLRRHLARDGYRVHELQHQCSVTLDSDGLISRACSLRWPTPGGTPSGSSVTLH
jgi:glycine amidinotransferase